MGIKEGFSDRSGGKGIGLNQNGSLGIIQLFNNGVRAATLGGEINRPGWAWDGLLLGLDGSGKG
jgi:hypothetical protein